MFYFCPVYNVDRSKYFSSDGPYYAIPIAQISWSMPFPSHGSTAVAVVGQVLGWILGWLTLQLLATRYVNNLSQVESCELVP